jgi:hypothetical protein
MRLSFHYIILLRAKSIKNTASINKDMSQKALLSAYQKEIQQLKEKLSRRYSGIEGRSRIAEEERRRKGKGKGVGRERERERG